MWYYYAPRHKRSWWKKHSLDILTAIGILMVFGIPLFVMFTQ